MKKILFPLVLVFISSAFAKDFKFSDYAVPVYKGKMVNEIRRDNAYAKLYKTRLTSDMKENGVNFAGHYSLVRIGCGLDCGTVGIVDVKTGKVYHDKWLKAFSSFFLYPDVNYSTNDEIIEYRKDSRLLMIKGVYDSGERGQFWLEFKNGRLHLLKKIPI